MNLSRLGLSGALSVPPAGWVSRRGLCAGWALVLVSLSASGCKKAEPLAQAPSESKSGEVSSGSLDTSAVLNFLSSLGLSGDTAEKEKQKEKEMAAAKVSQFNQELEQWKARAKIEFPDLGLPGSEFNRSFLEKYGHWKNIEATELKLPNWPYLLALQVNAAIESQKAMNTAKAVGKTPEPAPVISPVIPPGTLTPDRFATYVPKDLLAMKQLPVGGLFKGRLQS